MDLLSPKINITFRNKYYFKTKIGGILTIFLSFLYLFIIHHYFNQFFNIENNNKTSLMIEYNQKADENTIISVIFDIDRDLEILGTFNYYDNVIKENCNNSYFTEVYENYKSSRSYICFSIKLVQDINNIQFDPCTINNITYQCESNDKLNQNSTYLARYKLNFFIIYKYVNLTNMDVNYKVLKFYNQSFYKSYNYYFDYISLQEELGLFSDSFSNQTYYEMVSDSESENKNNLFEIDLKYTSNIRRYRRSYEKIYHTLKKIFYLMNIIYVVFNLINNFLSDYYFMRYILIIYKNKQIESNNNTYDVSISNTLRKINIKDSNRFQVLDEYYILINYVKYYLA